MVCEMIDTCAMFFVTEVAKLIICAVVDKAPERHTACHGATRTASYLVTKSRKYLTPHKPILGMITLCLVEIRVKFMQKTRYLRRPLRRVNKGLLGSSPANRRPPSRQGA